MVKRNDDDDDNGNDYGVDDENVNITLVPSYNQSPNLSKEIPYLSAMPVAHDKLSYVSYDEDDNGEDDNDENDDDEDDVFRSTSQLFHLRLGSLCAVDESRPGRHWTQFSFSPSLAVRRRGAAIVKHSRQYFLLHLSTTDGQYLHAVFVTLFICRQQMGNICTPSSH